MLIIDSPEFAYNRAQTVTDNPSYVLNTSKKVKAWFKAWTLAVALLT